MRIFTRQGFTRQGNESYFDALAGYGLLSVTPMPVRGPYRMALRLIGLAAVVLVFLATAYAQHAHKVHHPKRVEREEVQALEEQWRQAMLSDDVTAMDKLLGDDYLGVTAGGDMVTKMQQLDRMRNRQIVIKKLDTSDVKLKLVGQIAIVTALSQVEAVSDGRTINGSFRNTRIYQQLSNGMWKITNFETTRVVPRVRSAQTVASGPGKG